MLNWIWLAMVLGSVAYAAWSGHMVEVSKASLDATKTAVQLVIGLTGGMVLFLGLVRVASEGGLLGWIVRGLRPILRRAFPEVPEEHPAMHAMIMNFAANMMGLGNAATPFGVKAMTELDKLNRHPGVATNAMALFLAINTSSIVLLPPTGTVMVRVATDSAAPFAIWLPTLFATLCSTTVAVITCLLLMRLPWFRVRPEAAVATEGPAPGAPAAPAAVPAADTLPELEREIPPMKPHQWIVIGAFLAVYLGGLISSPPTLDEFANHWLLPLLIAGFLLIGVRGGVRVYETVVDAGREGLQVAVRIAPYLVVIMVGIAMFRASGALDVIVAGLDPLTGAFGVPAESLPMALLRPLSGSGAFAVMSEILETHGPDSQIGLLTSTLMGSTETTFYVLAVYLGAAGIRDARHILPACLAGDLAGFAGAVTACHFFFG